MKLWNVFRMEVFKNLNDRTNLFVMLVLMCVNTIGGLVMANQRFSRRPSSLEEMIIGLFILSVVGTVIFLFFYPYQMARTDYKNNVMSLMIASGVSRIQYYFVKVGSTLLFSFISVTLLAIVPWIIVLISSGGIEFSIADVYYVEIVEIGSALGMLATFLVGWLSSFSMLMTSVIIARGKAVTIFVFFGISIAASQITALGRALFGIDWWQITTTVTLVQHLITMVALSLMGIMILRKQDL